MVEMLTSYFYLGKLIGSLARAEWSLYTLVAMVVRASMAPDVPERSSNPGVLFYLISSFRLRRAIHCAYHDNTC
jgi:hypothetical protein